MFLWLISCVTAEKRDWSGNAIFLHWVFSVEVFVSVKHEIQGGKKPTKTREVSTSFCLGIFDAYQGLSKPFGSAKFHHKTHPEGEMADSSDEDKKKHDLFCLQSQSYSHVPTSGSGSSSERGEQVDPRRCQLGALMCMERTENCKAPFSPWKRKSVWIQQRLACLSYELSWWKFFPEDPH